MSECSHKVTKTCTVCLGAGYHNYLYPEETKCGCCNGKGEVTWGVHEYVQVGSSKMGTMAYFKCKYCGDRQEYNQGN